MVDPVANAGVADSLEARLADVRKRHADGEYGTIPLLIVELGIRSQWATEHPSRPVSPRPVQNEGGVDNEVDGGARDSGNNGTKHLVCCRRWLTSLSSTKRWRALGDDACDGGRDCTDVWLLQVLAGPDHRRTATRSTGPHHLEGAIESQLEVAELKGFADGTVPIPPVDDVELRGEFRAAQLVTFMVISRCCLPVVQLALRSCRERLDAGHQAWHFILSTYQVRDDLYIRQLEEKMTHFRMGEQESAMDYCNRARRILAEMRMAGAEYSTTSYISHIVKGLPRGYNLMKRMMMLPGTHESLDEDSVTGYILQDEAMQEAEQPTELPPQANYAASTKVNQQQGQRGRPGGGGSGDVEEDVVDEGRRQLQRQEPRRRGGVVLNGRRSGADGFAGAGGWRGLPGGGGSCAGKPDGGAARQRLLPPPDGDEGGLRRHGAERQCEARAWIQRGAAARRGSRNYRPARGGREAGPHPRRALRSRRTGKLAIYWLAEGERSAAAGRWRRDAARRCDRGGARSRTLQRASPLHRPSPLLDAIVVDRGGGSTDDRLGDEVDP
ncbi:unnamed protein product [Closterium sp. NIES-54]